MLGGLFECAWAMGLKYTDGFTRPVPSVLTVLAIVASMWLLAVAARTLPIGTAYPVWVGIGAVGSVLLGVLLFKERWTRGARSSSRCSSSASSGCAKPIDQRPPNAFGGSDCR